ncbi:putative NADH dehydrogenase [ubiquinone] 1 alpha subcomplex subunit 12 [Helianthus debilis subsp. tardiflorus]
MSRIWSRLSAMLRNRTFIGADKAGNQYYVRTEQIDGIMKEKRWVEFKGEVDSTSIPDAKGLQSADHICRHLQEKRWTKGLQSARRRGFVFFTSTKTTLLYSNQNQTSQHNQTSLSTSLSVLEPTISTAVHGGSDAGNTVTVNADGSTAAIRRSLHL